MNDTNKRSEMLEMLITIGLSLSSAIGIGEVIAIGSLAKGLIERIGKKDAFGILKKALDKTIKEAGDTEAKDILKSLKDDNKPLREFHERLDMSEETRKSLVSQYFDGRDDVLENLAKNYYELFCKAAIKKDGAFKEFAVTGLMGLKTQGIITNEAVKNVERYLEGITEDLKRIKEAESRQFLITSDLNEVVSEISGGMPEIGYVERDEIKEVKEALKTTDKLIVVGKPGAGKTRFMLRVLEDFDCDRFVVIRRFFRENGITTLDAELQEFDSFVVVWDDLHRAKDDLVKSAIKQIEQLAREKDRRFLFIGTSRASDKYYGFEPAEKEISLDDFRSLELVEGCAAHFGVSVEAEVKEKIPWVGDGTPFYVISLFATLKEQGKKELTPEDLGTLPEDSFDIWCKHLKFLDGKGELSTSEKYVLRSIALAMHAVRRIDFETLGEFYEHVFRGRLYFENDLNDVINKFFIGKEGEFYFIHAVQVWAVESEYPLDPLERYIGRLRKALTSLERDKSLILLVCFADWLYRSKKYAMSLKFWDAFIEKEPTLAGIYNNRGAAYTELNQYERAIEDYNRALELDLKDAGAYSNRGVAYTELNQYERAIEDCNKALELDLKDAGAYSNRGAAYAGLNQYKRAIEDYNKAIELNPNLADAYNNRGDAYAGLNQYKRAIEDFSKAIELNPEYAVAYSNRGATYTELNQYEGAIEDYNKAIELDPKDAGVYGNRGNAYARLNQHERAIEDYDKAVELNPEYAGAYSNRGSAYTELNQYERAIEDYNRALELNPNLADAYNNRGTAYIRSNHYGKAIEDYNKAIELDPKDAGVYGNRGNAYARLNQHERAIEDYDKAVELNPEYAGAYANRGIAYTLITKYDKSTRDLKRGGVLFLKSGRTDDAIKCFNSCFNLRDKIGNDGVIYCGLAIYLMTLDADVILEIRKMQAEDEVLERIVDLMLRKLNGEDVSDEMEEMGKMDEQEDAKVLLDLLKIF